MSLFFSLIRLFDWFRVTVIFIFHLFIKQALIKSLLLAGIMCAGLSGMGKEDKILALQDFPVTWRGKHAMKKGGSSVIVHRNDIYGVLSKR